MKIMFVGDMHGALLKAEAAVSAAVESNADVMIQAGDFGIWTHTKGGVFFLNELQRFLDKHDMVLYFVDGNHENFEHLYEYPLTPSGLRIVRDNIIHMPRGKVVVWDGIKIMAFGGANSIDGPKGALWWSQARGPATFRNTRGFEEDLYVDLGNWWAEEEVTEEQVDAVEEQKVDILVSHECPTGIDIPGIDRTYPEGTRQRDLLRKVVDKTRPELLIHGHYHRRYSGLLDNGLTVVEGLGDNTGSIDDMTLLLDTEKL